MKSNNAVNFALLALLLLWFGLGTAIALAVDYLWFGALDHDALFMTSIGARLGIWLITFTLGLLLIGGNARAAWRDGPINFGALGTGGESELKLSAWQIERMARQALSALVLLLALGFANGAARAWMEVLSWSNSEPFGALDPVFGRDIGFYFFELPTYELLHQLLLGMCFVSLAFVAGIHFLRQQLQAPWERRGGPPGPKVVTIGPGVDVLRQLDGEEAPRGLSDGARAHILNLGALSFLLLAVGSWLERFDLLTRRSSAVYGAGYADIHAQIPVYWIMAAAAVGVAVVLVGSIFREGWRGPVAAVVGYLGAGILLNGLYPSLVQKFYVTPNELEVEREFLERNIQATREAYDLDKIEVRPFEAATDLDMADIEANPLTIDNIRLWDTQPLLTTYSQLQEIRLYYDFVDVDVDRYTIDGKLRQVMLAAREMNHDNLDSQARTFVNQRLQYTHGYGLTMSPVNVVTEEGLPDLFVQDIPPASVAPELAITRPEIYYGELTDDFVLVRTGADEFDYPLGDQNQYTRYTGSGGVSIGSLGRRLLFAAHFKSADILLSGYIQDDSAIMFRRDIRERVRRLAPFLSYDSDPYIAVADGRLYWIIDAYTVSDRYPYSEERRTSDGRRINYIRNAVKVIVDAYNGSVDFYIADDTDPVARVYDRIFEGTFRPLDELPEGLRAHLRHPVDFFEIQAEMYRAYHMTDPTVFYNKEDMWELPTELYGGQAQRMKGYYLIMKLPESERAEFVLLLPFVPTNRENMISWLAARSDPPHNGELVLYQFPKQKLIFGPRQIESRIDQNPEISEQITLWSQSGSRVVRGNLLVIPIEDSLMYVEPLFLQAESSQLPELKRVIVSYEQRIAMRETLDAALEAIFSAGAPPVSEPDAGGGEPAPPALAGEWQALVERAAAQLEGAEAAQRAGDWAGYGEALAALRATIQQLEATSEGAVEGAE